MTQRTLLLTLMACAASVCFPAAALRLQPSASIKTETLALVDQARNRPVPVVVSAPERAGALKPAIISHGYGAKNTDHTFIATYLATHNYYVASIQHEVPGDAPMPTTGNVYDTRKPYWERGVQNMLFVIGELKRRRPDLDYQHLLLIGHSNGGDASMLFAQEHPDLVDTVISLDNRRMPFPRTAHPRVYSIRSSDQPADPGVIPTADEQARYRMQVVTLPATIHNDMWDGGTETQKAEILRHIAQFLDDGR